MTMQKIQPNLDGSALHIGIVQARFNADIGNGLLAGCTDELTRLGVDTHNVLLTTVPGALEIPLVLQTMAQTGQFDALIALGAVIRGETYHFEIVSNEMARGIGEVQLDCGIPIANAVLTTENDDQAIARMHQKGAEAAQCAVEMAQLLAAIQEGAR
jgi:6,7-dimethyl-8-ribityllumazine synthase